MFVAGFLHELATERRGEAARVDVRDVVLEQDEHYLPALAGKLDLPTRCVGRHDDPVVRRFTREKTALAGTAPAERQFGHRQRESSAKATAEQGVTHRAGASGIDHPDIVRPRFK